MTLEKSVGIKNRTIYMDLLRVIAIFAVIVLHVCAVNWYAVDIRSFHWQTLNVFDGAVRWCVPVFVMISGAFLLSSEKNYSIKDLYTKKILRIVVAFLFWSLLYILADKSVISNGFLYTWLTGGRYHLWFLFTIVSLYIIAPFLRCVCCDKRVTEYFIVLWFVFVSVWMALSLVQGFPPLVNMLKSFLMPGFVVGYSGYFVLGYYLANYDLPRRVTITIYVLGVMSLAVTIIGTAYMSIKNNIGYGSLYDYLMPNTAFISIALFLLFKNKITNTTFTDRTNRRIVFLSKLSFGVYLVHELFLELFSRLNITTGGFFAPVAVVGISIAVFILSNALAYVISKIPFVSKYIM